MKTNSYSPYYSLFVLVIAVNIVCLQANYQNTQQLVDDNGVYANYDLYWSIINSDTIQIKISAKTSGWIGFGLSPNGTMVYSDVVIGWMASNSQTFFDDRYAIQYSKPPTDIDLGGENNVQLLSLTYIDGWTTIEYSRPLKTGDVYDVDFVPGNMQIVWAMGYPDDNPTDGNIQRHQYRSVNDVTFIEGEVTAPTQRPPTCNGVNSQLEYSGDSNSLLSLRVETLSGHIDVNMDAEIGVTVTQSAYTSELLSTLQTNFITNQPNFWAVLSQRGSSATSSPSTEEGPSASSTPGNINKEVLEGECIAADIAVNLTSSKIIPVFSGITYDGNIYLNGGIVSKAMNLQTVGGLISGSFKIEGVADFQINSEPSSLIIEAEKEMGFSGEIVLKVLVKGYAGKYHVEVNKATHSISVDGDFFTPISSSSTFESGYVGYEGTQTSFNITADCDVVVLFYHDSSAKTFDIIMPNYNVPAQRTSYICTPYTLPADEDYHAIRFDAIVEHSSVVHHMVLYNCNVPQSGEPYDCSNMDPECTSILYVWAVGGKNFYLPEVAGFPIGKNSAKYGILQVHYDNPNALANVWDNSGIKMFYTNELRKYDAGILEIGVNYLEIPPQQEAFQVGENKYGCPSECMSNHIPLDGEITVFASMLHAHLAGREIWTEHFRQKEDGTYVQIEDLNHNIYYDFNLQEYTVFDPPHKILPTDALVTYCVYNTMDRNYTTYLGLSTAEEMCFNFVAYYPLSDWGYCLGIEEHVAYCDNATPVKSWSSIPESTTVPVNPHQLIDNSKGKDHQNV